MYYKKRIDPVIGNFRSYFKVKDSIYIGEKGFVFFICEIKKRFRPPLIIIIINFNTLVKEVDM